MVGIAAVPGASSPQRHRRPTRPLPRLPRPPIFPPPPPRRRPQNLRPGPSAASRQHRPSPHRSQPFPSEMDVALRSPHTESSNYRKGHVRDPRAGCPSTSTRASSRHAVQRPCAGDVVCRPTSNRAVDSLTVACQTCTVPLRPGRRAGQREISPFRAEVRDTLAWLAIAVSGYVLHLCISSNPSMCNLASPANVPADRRLAISLDGHPCHGQRAVTSRWHDGCEPRCQARTASNIDAIHAGWHLAVDRVEPPTR